MFERKPRLNVVVIGSLQSGKSTTIGHLLYGCGIISEREITKNGEDNRNYAWAVDMLEVERIHSTTTDNACSRLETSTHTIIIIDTPGNRSFLETMITGSFRADCAIMVVSSNTNMQGDDTNQIREYLTIVSILGIPQLIVVINKMDLTHWSQNSFDEISQWTSELIDDSRTSFLYATRYHPESVPFIPISGLCGDNLVERSHNMAWYNGWSKVLNPDHEVVIGTTLLDAVDAIDAMSAPDEKNDTWRSDMSLRISILDVHTTGHKTTLVGRVEAGLVKGKMTILFSPSKLVADIRSVGNDDASLSQGNPGDIVAFHIDGNFVEDVHPGDLASDPENDPAKEAASFEAQLYIIRSDVKISVGYRAIVDCHAAHTVCEFSRLIKVRRDTWEGDPVSFKCGEVVIAELTPMKPICIETFQTCPSLGRIIIRDAEGIVACGVINSVVPKLDG